MAEEEDRGKKAPSELFPGSPADKGEGSDSSTATAPPPDESGTGQTEVTESDTDDSGSDDNSFREEQARLAKAQNQQGDNAVPEQRPQAFQRTDDSKGEFAQKLEDQGVNAVGVDDSQPMDKAAYDRASNQEPEGERHEGFKIADSIRITDDHPVEAQRGRQGSIVRVVSYHSVEDEALRNAGTPDSRFVQPKEVEVSFRGGDAEGQNLPIETQYLERIDQKQLRVNG